jgi:hypothetical protein
LFYGLRLTVWLPAFGVWLPASRAGFNNDECKMMNDE